MPVFGIAESTVEDSNQFKHFIHGEVENQQRSKHGAENCKEHVTSLVSAECVFHHHAENVEHDQRTDGDRNPDTNPPVVNGVKELGKAVKGMCHRIALVPVQM